MGANKIYTKVGAGPHLLTPPVHPLAAEGYSYPEPTRLYMLAQTQASQFRVGDFTALGAELVTNGAFAADTDWTKGVGWTIAAGIASSDASQSADSDLEQDTDDTGAEIIAGEFYTVVMTVSGRTAGGVTPVLGGTAGTQRTTNATHTETIQAGTDGKIIIRADQNFDGDIDGVSVKRAIMVYDATPAAAANGTSAWHMAAGATKDIPANADTEVTVIGENSSAIFQYYWE